MRVVPVFSLILSEAGRSYRSLEPLPLPPLREPAPVVPPPLVVPEPVSREPLPLLLLLRSDAPEPDEDDPLVWFFRS